MFILPKSNTLLGHVISEEGIDVDPEEVKEILELPTPKNVERLYPLWES